MKVPPTGLNRGVIGWARPSPFTPLPFGSLLFAFHLLRGSLVDPRPTWARLCSHFSFPQPPSPVPTNFQALTLTLPIKLIKMAKHKSASENPRGADSKHSPSSTPSPIITWELVASGDGVGATKTSTLTCPGARSPFFINFCNIRGLFTNFPFVEHQLS